MCLDSIFYKLVLFIQNMGKSELNQSVIKYISNNSKKFKYAMPNNYYFQVRTEREDNSSKDLILFGGLVDIVARTRDQGFLRSQSEPDI